MSHRLIKPNDALPSAYLLIYRGHSQVFFLSLLTVIFLMSHRFDSQARSRGQLTHDLDGLDCFTDVLLLLNSSDPSKKEIQIKDNFLKVSL